MDTGSTTTGGWTPAQAPSPDTHATTLRHLHSVPVATTAVGGFYLAMAGINAGLAIADASLYRHFADAGLFGFVRDGWAQVVMVHPQVWVALLAAAEALIGASLLAGGRFARAGWMGVLAFHVLLLPFGFGVWIYAVPALVFFAWLAHRDWRFLRVSSP